MEDKVKCSKCGKLNINGANKCSKCMNRLDNLTKSCPKCAKRNLEDAKRCSSCNYNFDGNSSIVFSAILSVVVVFVLCTMVYLKKSNVITNNISIIYKVIGGLGIFSLLVATLTNGRRDVIKFDKSSLITDSKFVGFKNISYRMILIAIVFIVILAIYIYISIF